MKAKLYVNNQFIGEIAYACPLIGGRRRDLRLNDTVTVAFVKEHPDPTSRPLFLSGRVEQA